MATRGVLLAGGGDHRELAIIPAERRPRQGAVAEHDEGRPAEGVDGAALVDGGAVLGLLRGHEACRSEAQPGVRHRTALVAVEIDHMQPMRGEIVEQAAIVEILHHPAARGQEPMQVDDRVEDGEDALGGSWRKRSRWARRSRTPSTQSETSSGRMAGLEHRVQARQQRMITGAAQLRRGAQELPALGVIQGGQERSSSRPAVLTKYLRLATSTP